MKKRCFALIVLIVLALCLSACSSGRTSNRTKLNQTITVDIGYIDDQLGWLSEPSTVEKAMKTFYKKTGVMPYLIITNDIGGAKAESEAEKYMQKKYYELFTRNRKADEAHLLVIWYQENGSKDYVFMYAGSSANGVIDSNARDTIYNYFNRFYTTDLTDDEFFANVFEESAKEIMK